MPATNTDHLTYIWPKHAPTDVTDTSTRHPLTGPRIPEAMSPEIVLSIVSPVYAAEGIVDELVKRLHAAASRITEDYEILLVEDRGPDRSWERIVAQCRSDVRVRGVRLSRNFGQHFAITAGLDLARGKHVVVMDCDLQDDPAYIPALHAKALEGFDIVHTVKANRAHGWWKNFTAGLYYRVYNYLVDSHALRSDSRVGTYCLISAKVVRAFRAFNAYHRHFHIVLRWLGFERAYVPVEHHERFAGKSSYDLGRLLRFAIDGITSQSDKLLRMFITLGFSVSLVAFLAILVIVIAYFTHGFLLGWPSLIVVILMSTGLILTGIGVLGLYLGKTFEQTKNLPKYIIDDQLNFPVRPGTSAGDRDRSGTGDERASLDGRSTAQ